MYATKPVFGSYQSDQHLYYMLISRLAMSKIAFLLLVSVAEETDLSLTVTETLKIGYVASGPSYPMGLNRPTS